MSLIAEIISGDHDDNLDEISKAIRERRDIWKKTTSAITMATLNVGDTVRFKDIRPKYLIGATATITDKKRTKFECRMTETIGKYRAGVPVIVPSTCVEKV